jgi:superfamily II DNA or RNA helicase
MFLPKFYGIQKFGVPKENKLDEPEKISIKFEGSLRDEQKAVVDICIQKAKETGGGIISLDTGFGKTVLAIYLLTMLSVKGLIIINKEFLLDQWVERIKFFCPTARIGIIRQKKIDIENKDIVIGMLQSIAMCDYDINIFSSFGISIYDEVHCVPSKIFSKSLRKIQTRYHFGLSATPNRADGMTQVTKLFIGDIIVKKSINTKKNPKNVKVLKVSFNKLPPKNYSELNNRFGKPDVVRMITNKMKCPYRITMIVKLIEYLLEKDRHILILSERINYLHKIYDKIKTLKTRIGYYIGGMKSKDRKESESANILLASYSMAKEAMDIQHLDTLIMVSSKSNVVQSVGRIQRKKEYPKDKFPLIVDIVDNFSSFSNQAIRRTCFYKKSKFPIYNVKLDFDKLEKTKEEIDKEMSYNEDDGVIILDDEDISSGDEIS